MLCVYFRQYSCTAGRQRRGGAGLRQRSPLHVKVRFSMFILNVWLSFCKDAIFIVCTSCHIHWADWQPHFISVLLSILLMGPICKCNYCAKTIVSIDVSSVFSRTFSLINKYDNAKQRYLIITKMTFVLRCCRACRQTNK